jgi:hypothetical protein
MFVKLIQDHGPYLVGKIVEVNDVIANDLQKKLIAVEVKTDQISLKNIRYSTPSAVIKKVI